LTRLIGGAHVVGQAGETVPHGRTSPWGSPERSSPGPASRRGKTLVAVNEDPEAPFLRLADVGAVGHRNTVVPASTEGITARTG